MRTLTPAERRFLQRVSGSKHGQLGISGNYDHGQWNLLLQEGYLDRYTVQSEPDTYMYAITEKGRSDQMN
jgi:hypothetical protein